MSSDSTIITCKDCDYKSKWKCNVKRHMVRKHNVPNVVVPVPNVVFSVPNVVVPVPNVVVPVPNVVFSENNDICPIIPDHNSNISKTCEKCKCIFSRRDKMLKHTVVCKGKTNNLTCEYCNNTYADRFSKSHHYRVCKAKKEKEMQSLVVVDVPPMQTQEPSTLIQNITNNTINLNNIIQNIIVYDPKNMELLNDHISKRELTKMMNVTDRDFPRVLTDYSKALLRRSENQCIRKTNLRSSSSAVHVGDNKWEYHSDIEVLPKLLSNIATNLGNIQHDYKIKIIHELDTFIIDVQSEAVDCHEDLEEETRLKELFKRTLTNVKHLLFNLTKEAIAEKRKNIKVE